MEWKPKRFFTPEQVEDAMTSRGGFSRVSLSKLGVPWPPPKGWRKAITKKETVCDDAASEVLINDDPSKRTPEEWYALIPKLSQWAFKTP